MFNKILPGMLLLGLLALTNPVAADHDEGDRGRISCIGTVGSCDHGSCIGTVGSCNYGSCIGTVGSCDGGSCILTKGTCDGGSCVLTIGSCTGESCSIEGLTLPGGSDQDGSGGACDELTTSASGDRITPAGVVPSIRL